MLGNTLTGILESKKNIADKGITFIESNSHEVFLSYGGLYHAARRGLSFLQSRGVQPKNEVIIQTEDNRLFITCFWACILGGMIPVPLSVGQTDDHKQKLFRVWTKLNNPYLLTDDLNASKLETFAQQHDLMEVYASVQPRTLSEAGIGQAAAEGEVYEAGEEDIAFVQFSSGSTGSPKGVTLTHRNLIVNMEAISRAAAYAESDSTISWMPLTHDMGLIGFHLNPLLIGMNQYLLPTKLFIRWPAVWLDKASKHRVSVMCSPNFGYKYVLKHCNGAEYNWDLSGVRLLYNGAEPISERLCETFLGQLEKYGLKSCAMCPVYGLAEASLAVSISGLPDEVRAVYVDRYRLNVGDEVYYTAEGSNSVAVVNVGKAINHCLLKITDAQQNAVPENTVGAVQIKGENVTRGYYNDPEATANAIAEDGWLNTGDLGFISEGNLYITGRSKDVIFVNGLNYYAHDIERIAEHVEDVELNKVAVLGYFDGDLQKEQVIAFVFHRGDLEKFIPKAKALRAYVAGTTGVEFGKIIPVKDIPRTTSGKMQRFRLLEQYTQGAFDAVERALQQKMQELEANAAVAATPANEVEEKLLALWKQVLHQDSVPVTRRFFEAGGNSLKAAELAMLILKEFRVELPLETLFKSQTIQQLAREIAVRETVPFTPIQPVREREYYPATSAQKRLYHHWELEKQAINYNLPVAFRVTGELDPKKAEACIEQLIGRHDALRMSFTRHTDLLFRVDGAERFVMPSVVCPKEEVDQQLVSLVQPFDLENGPLFRIVLLIVPEGDCILFVDFHHIISDGVSVASFVQELLNLYRGDNLPATAVQYRDYTCWEKESLKTDRIRQQAAYWFAEMQEALPTLEMPSDFQRPVVFDPAGAKLEFRLSAETTDRLRSLATANQCTLHAVMLSLYGIMLTKYTGQKECVIGIPVAGRNHPDLQQVQGMFVNNLAIRTTVGEEATFVQFLASVAATVLKALHNGEYPFEYLVEAAGKRRDASRNAVFDTMFVYQNMEAPRSGNASFQLSRYFFDPGVSKFDLSLEVFDGGGALQYTIEYATCIYRKETILGLAKHLENLIALVLDAPHCPLAALSVITGEECNRYVRAFNDTATPYPQHKTIHRLFEEQVARTPDNVAVEWEGERLTYRQLNERANQLADALRRMQIAPGDIVGVLLPRSPELLVSILGILKAGGAFLPIETDLPEERIRYLLENSRAGVVITGKAANGGSGRPWEAQILAIDEANFTGCSKLDGPGTGNAGNLAYVIYTSGTTGNPKGVMIEHQSLVNYTCWAVEQYVKGEAVAFPLFTSVSFDLTITSIFAPLVSGNTIVIYGEGERAHAVENVIRENKVEVVKLTPSHLRILRENKIQLAGASRIKRFIVGGEKLETYLAQEIHDSFGGNIEIYNEYGPTEATVGCMIHAFEAGSDLISVPIGVPADNTQVYVLDQYLNPVPAGVHGQLYISGTGMARGYLGNERLTRDKFVPNPFLDGQMMYKTGDVARMLHTGVIEYVGRSDQQVKIRGYRVELSEIEHQLMSHGDIAQALVAVRGDQSNGPVLYAYCVRASKADAFDLAALKHYLAGRMPHYMIPTQIIWIDRIPLTKNGKVDYDALPEPAAGEYSLSREPANEVEQIALAVWQQVLNNPYLTPLDDFIGAGGDSIKAIQIASRLFEKGILLRAKDILTYHTIEQSVLRAQPAGGNGTYRQDEVTGEKGLAPIEAWFFNQRLANPDYFNQSVLLTLHKAVCIDTLEKTLSQLVVHHDGLRLNYNRENNKLFYNSLHLHRGIRVEVHELGSDQGGALTGICSAIKGSMNIADELLIKAAVIRIPGEGDLLLITAHHLVVDGISWRILLEDLYAVYQSLERGKSLPLPRKTASLLDWQRELEEYAGSPDFQRERHYWTSLRETHFSLPQDFETNDWRTANLARVTERLSKDKTAFLLSEANQTYKTDAAVLLNTALVLALEEWTGSNAFVIEQENHGRHLEALDVSRTVGWFTAKYPVRLDYIDGPLGEQIKAVKEQLRKIPNQGIGYGLRTHYGSRQQSAPATLSEVRFNYLGQFGQELDNDLFSYSPRESGNDVGPENVMSTKLEINLMVVGGELNLEIKYNRKAFKETTIRIFKTLFSNHLQGILIYLHNTDEVDFTPSDFDAANLDDEELNALFC